jgi:hypothetical protein
MSTVEALRKYPVLAKVPAYRLSAVQERLHDENAERTLAAQLFVDFR